MYAVIKTGGKQCRVSQGDTLDVEKLTGEVGEQVALDTVLFIGGNGEVKIGAPTLTDAKVTAEIVEHRLARKIIVFKKKRRKGYSRYLGLRHKLSRLKIFVIQG